MAWRRFELVEGNSKKFWNIKLEGSSHAVQYGRIGTTGRSLTKDFDDRAAAKKSFDKLIDQKVGKGYRESAKKSRAKTGTGSKKRSGRKPAVSRPVESGPFTLVRTHRVKERCQATAAAFSPDGSLLAVAYSDMGFACRFANKVLIWDLVRWRKVKLIRGCSDNVDDVTFTPDGKKLVCVGGCKKHFMGGEIKTWNTHHWEVATTIDGEEIDSLRSVAVTPDGKLVATGSALSGKGIKLQLWDAASGKCTRTFGELGDDVKSLQFSPGGKSLAVGVAGDRTASVWAIPNGRKRWLQRAHAEANDLPVVFSPDGKLLASCGDKNIALWNAHTGKRHAILKGHGHHVNTVAFSPDGNLLYSSAWREFRIWDVSSGRTVGSQALPEMNAVKIGISPSGGELTAVHTINDELCIMQYRLGSLPSEGEGITTVEKERPRSEREEKLIAAVLADPDNDAPRLKFAQWLDDQGNPRGEFIRIQCKLCDLQSKRKLTARQKGQKGQLANQEQKLLKKHLAEWTAPLADLQVRPEVAVFRRGFLWKLELRDIDVTDKSLELLKHVPELERLDLQGSSVTDKGMRHLKAVSNLCEIDVGETKVTAGSLGELKGLKRLVRVYNYEWGNEKNVEIENFKKTRNSRFLALPKKKQRAEALRALEIITYLRPDKNGAYTDVSFSQSWATDADLVYLQAIPEIEETSFFECFAVTQEGLKHLRPLKRLRKLRLSESGVTDLAPLRHLQRLEELDISSLERLDPSSFRHLAALKKLQQLTLRFCHLGDEILSHIGKCAELRGLYTDYNEFTEEGLQHLLNLKKLKKVELDYMDDYADLVAQLLG